MLYQFPLSCGIGAVVKISVETVFTTATAIYLGLKSAVFFAV
jgi:hypothetical protein